MAKKLTYILTLVVITSLGWGQLKSDLPVNNPVFNDVASNDNALFSLFEPQRFNMRHSFSMSMINMNNRSIGVASYTNNINFTLRDNLRLQTYITFLQPNMLSANSETTLNNSQVYFDAVLNYKPSANSHFSVSFGNHPTYRRYYTTPLLLNRIY